VLTLRKYMILTMRQILSYTRNVVIQTDRIMRRLIRIVIHRGLRRTGHETRMGDKGCVKIFLAGKPFEKCLFGRTIYGSR
jgi:hypothetical protein